MSAGLTLSELIEYTDWERGLWHHWLGEHGDAILATSAGPHGDGRFQTVGDICRHIFSAEKRYIDRLCGRPLTDTSSIASNHIAALFDFGAQSRRDLKQFVEQLPADEWEVFRELPLMNGMLKASPRKIVIHALLHEVRHWAQIGTLFRLQGLNGEFHDFIFSPVLGGGFNKQAS